MSNLHIKVFCDVSTSELKTKYSRKVIFMLRFNQKWTVMLQYNMMEWCDLKLISFIGAK